MGQASELYAANSRYLHEQLEKQKEFHEKNLASYRAAREEYLKKVGGRAGEVTPRAALVWARQGRGGAG